MKTLLLKSVLAFGLVAASASSAFAQGSGPGANTVPNNPVVNNTPLKAFTIDQLADALRRVGQQPTVNNANGKSFVSFTVKEPDGWTVVVEGIITPASVWWTAPLGNKLGSPEQIPASKILALLEANTATIPCFFTYRPQSGLLCMQLETPHPAPNDQSIKGDVAFLVKGVKNSYNLWKTENFGPVNVGQNQANPPVQPIPANAPGQGVPQAPVVAPAPVQAMNLTGSIWNGQEDLDKYGKLAFHFGQGNAATMVDADGNHPGTFTVEGNQITLAFYNGTVIYRGTRNANTIAGTGDNGKNTWKFAVSHSSPVAAN